MRRLAIWTTGHRKTAVVLWLLVLLGTAFAAGRAGADFKQDFNIPKSDSRQALDLLKRNFPAQAGDTAQIVFYAPRGVRSAAVERRMRRLFAKAARVEGVSGVQSPYAPRGERFISPRGTVAFATVQWNNGSRTLDPAREVEPLIAAARAARAPGLAVELGGASIEQAQQQKGNAAEAVGLFAAIIVLLVTFGSVVAMGMPIVTALVALGTSMSLITLATHVFKTADFTTALATMIGLGVGIDYALFIVTRFRQGLRRGLEPRRAVVVAMDTAGRAVLFAGVTVVIALLGLFAIGMEFLYGPAAASSMTVLITMIAALTLLPALLAIVGRRIDMLRIPLRKSAGDALSDDEIAHPRWHAWSRMVQRRPWPVALLTAGLLMVLAIPAFSMRLGVADAGTDPAGTTTRKAYDLLARGFGPGFNGPLVIVTKTRDKASVARLAKELRGTPGIVGATPPQASPNGAVTTITVFPGTSPQSAQTKDLVHRLRDGVLARRTAAGEPSHIAGVTAVFDDFSTLIASKLPLFIGAVVLLSALLLMAVFRSVLVPLKAVLMNLLGIFAAFGVTVAIFQWGWGASLIGVSGTAPLIAFLPVMVFAIVFGLSMDYEVFLMSRVHEEWERRGDAAAAVVEGLAATGGVITAAAVIMISLFSAFAFLSNELTTKLFGIALATTIFLDAFIIRSALVPAIMAILGRRAWWLPDWLDRLLPRLNVEPPEELDGASAAENP